MHFANISTLGPGQTDLHGSTWSLQRHGLPVRTWHFPHHDIIDDDEHHGAPSEEDTADCRYERRIDLVPDKLTGELTHSCSNGTCRRIVISVSGQLYETQLGTLNRFPNTLLGNPAKRREYWDTRAGCYRLDRHPPSFNYILYYYQSGGKLFCPEDVPEDVFLSEVEFYELGDSVIRDYKLRNGHLPEQQIVVPKSAWRRKLWLLFEYPSTSVGARVIGVFSLLIILLSVINFCLESVPSFEQQLCTLDTSNVTTTRTNDSLAVTGSLAVKQNYRSVFFIVECICGIWFTIELIIRFVSCPYKKSFCKDIMNLFDIGAVVPFYVITLIVILRGECDQTKHSSISIVFLRVLRLFRSFRIFKLTKHSRGLQILGLTIRQSLKELALFGVFLCIAIIFYSAAIYYADLFDTKSTNFYSIPDGFWWAVVTMCTVGYGDKVPQGMLGKLVGTLCVVSGVVTIALVVPIVVSNFSNYYSHEPPRATTMVIVDSKGGRQVETITNPSSSARHNRFDATNKASCVIS